MILVFPPAVLLLVGVAAARCAITRCLWLCVAGLRLLGARGFQPGHPQLLGSRRIGRSGRYCAPGFINMDAVFPADSSATVAVDRWSATCASTHCSGRRPLMVMAAAGGPEGGPPRVS
jgi:hypothetical protein